MQKRVARKCFRFFALYNIEAFIDRVFEMILMSKFYRLTRNVTKSVHYM